MTDSQIKELQVQTDMSKNKSLPYVVLICLVTGVRWSEAEGLTVKDCVNQGFQFVETKNGQSRFVPVDESVFLQVKNRLKPGRVSFMLCRLSICF